MAAGRKKKKPTAIIVVEEIKGRTRGVFSLEEKI